MSKLCERPGCSEIGAAEYGMVPEDLLFWIAPLVGRHHDDQNVLCLRHADAMSVPRGWTLDDRREEIPRLFKPRASERHATKRAAGRSRRAGSSDGVEQLVIDGTGEIERPTAVIADAVIADETVVEPTAPWRPEFDQRTDLDGLLEVSSPLLARAFRGTERRRD